MTMLFDNATVNNKKFETALFEQLANKSNMKRASDSLYTSEYNSFLDSISLVP